MQAVRMLNLNVTTSKCQNTPNQCSKFVLTVYLHVRDDVSVKYCNGVRGAQNFGINVATLNRVA
jgi:hypothetical protein